jgi:hypothetical protein
MKSLRVVLSALVLFASIAAGAQPYDAAVAGYSTSCLPIDPPLLDTQVEWLGNEPFIDSETEVEVIAAAPGGRIFGIDGAREIVSVIRRFDVCTGTFLADFATVAGTRGLRILPGGDVIAAAGEELVRFDSSGAETRRYTHASWSDIGAIGLADGGTTLWLAERGCDAHSAHQIRLDTGAIVRTHALQMDGPSVSPSHASRVESAACSFAICVRCGEREAGVMPARPPPL